MIQTKVSFVVQIYDGFTNRPVNSSHFQVATQQPVVWMKRDNGCLVFCNCVQKEISIRLESVPFQPAQLTVRADSGAGQFPIHRVWAYPGKNYPLMENTLMVEGQAAPKEKVEFYPICKKKPHRLLADVEKGAKTIAIFHSDSEVLEGRSIFLYPQNVRLQLLEEGPQGFQLEQAAAEQISRSKTLVCLGYETIADSRGTYQIYAKGDGEYPHSGIRYMQNKAEEIQIEEAQVPRI